MFDLFPWVIGLIALTTFLLLVRAFRSVLPPLKAVLLNVLSVAATFGFVVLFWQHGLGSERSSTSRRQAPGTDVEVLATALGVGILIDATIVRALLVPALVALLGEWNWWLPAWLARPLRVEPSPRRREPVEVPSQRGVTVPSEPVA